MILNIFQIILIIIFFVIGGRKRNIYIDFLSRDYTNELRTIAILMVITHHVSNSLGSNLFTPFGGIGVAIFLIISGYGLNESYKAKGLIGFWKNKILRVALPCWLVDVVFACISWQSFDIIDFIQCVFCIKQDWYVRYLFYWYILFYVSTKYFRRYRLMFFSATSFLMLFSLPDIEAEQSVSFLIGFILSEYKENLSLKDNHYKITSGNKIFILLIIGILFLALKQIPLIREYEGTSLFVIIQLIMKITLALFVVLYYSIVVKIGYTSLFVRLCGLMSYELYLIHCKFLSLIKESPSYFSIVEFYTITFVLSYILYKIDNNITKFNKTCPK